MSVARHLLLHASRNTWLAAQLRQRSFFRRATRRFMPGEALEDALDAARVFAAEGIGTVLTELGEQVTTPDEVDAVATHYLGVLDRIAAQSLPADISLKLTHLGLDADAARCTNHVRTLATRAAAVGTRLWIDMEESHYVDETLRIFRTIRGEGLAVGLCLQAYLHRTPDDLASLLPLAPAVRLVKGAYAEPAAIALPRKADVDAQYEALAVRLFSSSGALAVFGTHDVALLARIAARASAVGVAPAGYEIHMLYGIRPEEQRRLAAAGHRVRVLVSYGSAWFAWYMRRLAERPANVWFVLRNMV